MTDSEKVIFLSVEGAGQEGDSEEQEEQGEETATVGHVGCGAGVALACVPAAL